MAPKMDEGMRLAERCNQLVAQAEERGFTVRMRYRGENLTPIFMVTDVSDTGLPVKVQRTIEITASRYTDPAKQVSAYHQLIDALEEVLGIAPRPVTLPIAVDRGMRV